MERGRRSPVATFYSSELPPAPGEATLGEAAAHHAAVRRLAHGDAVRLTDGQGTLAFGSIQRLAKKQLVVGVEQAESIPRPPLLELFLPVADRERMLWLAEKSTELGISVWQPVFYERSRSVSPRGEGEAFIAKVRARMIGALEQSGGAWLPEIRRERPLTEATARSTAPWRYVLDQGGRRLDPSKSRDGAAVALGPEGGFEPSEREHLRAAGWRSVTLAPTTLRFETAGVAAIAILRGATIRCEEDD